VALIDCPECRNSVSDKAVACPHCGRPITGDAQPPLPLPPPQKNPAKLDGGRVEHTRLAGGRHKFLGLSRTASRKVSAQIANVSSKKLRRAAKQAEPLAPFCRVRMAAHGPKSGVPGMSALTPLLGVKQM
jgi:hypothetical protein